MDSHEFNLPLKG